MPSGAIQLPDARCPLIPRELTDMTRSNVNAQTMMHTLSPSLSGAAPRLKITDVICHVLLAPDFDPSFTSSAQDSIVVVTLHRNCNLDEIARHAGEAHRNAMTRRRWRGHFANGIRRQMGLGHVPRSRFWREGVFADDVTFESRIPMPWA